MSGFFETNLVVLAARNPRLARVARAASPAYEVVPSKSGAPTARIERRFLHAPRDPLREAERLLRARAEKTPRPTAVVVLGFGLGYLLDAARARFPEAAAFVAVVEDAGALRSALLARDMGETLRDGRVRILLAEEADFQAFAEALDEAAAMEVLVVPFPPAVERAPEAFRRALDALGRVREMHRHSLLATASFAALWTRRLLENCEVLAEAEDAGVFFGAARGGPVGVAAAGPSLEVAREELPLGAARRIIAVDTAFPVFLGGDGRPPDPPAVVVSADAQDATARHFDDAPTEATMLLAAPTVPGEVFARPFERRFVFALPGAAFAWFQARLGITTPLRVGGSVFTSAFDLARRMEGDPILLFGADFSFSRASWTHARGTMYDRARLARTDRFHSLESLARDAARYAVEVKDGVRSREELVQYARWLEEEIRSAPALTVRAHRPSPLLSLPPAAAEDLAALSAAPPLRPPPPSDVPAGKRRVSGARVRAEAMHLLAACADDFERAAARGAFEPLRSRLDGPAGLFARAVLHAPVSDEERRDLARRAAEAIRGLLP